MIEHGQKISDLYRRLNNIIRIGKVKDVNYDTATATVQIGKITTAFMPWMVPSTDTWFPLKTGFFNDTATTEIYTLSLHDALPI